MLTKVKAAIARYGMLDDGCDVICGLSGGADSVSLVHALHTLGYRVRAVHVNHMIRGAEAQSDCDFAKDFCLRLGIPFEAYEVDVPKRSRELGIGLEECGRQVRYEIFERLSSKYGCKIATAHTLSDSAETVLFNIARGSSVSGLRGIPPVRGDIVRPLILASREDVEGYCAANGLSYVTDSTNSDTAYTRNMIRKEIVPRFRGINTSFLSAVARLSECAASDDEYLGTLAADFLRDNREEGGWRIERLKELADPIKRRAINMIAGGCDSRHIDLISELIENGSGAVEIDGERRAVIYRGMLSVGGKNTGIPEWSRELREGRISLPDSRELLCEIVRIGDLKTQENYDNLLFTEVVDYDIISERLQNGDTALLRNRRQGDRFSPAGRKITKQVRRLFAESGIPADRRSVPVMIELGGELVWLEGFGAAQGFAVGKSTQRVLVLRMYKGDEVS